jgi:radical SAM-linked protein
MAWATRRSADGFPLGAPFVSPWCEQAFQTRRRVSSLPPKSPDGPPPPPVVQRVRVCYAKRGRLRFTSHRDIQRAFERALRRASVPMAYSAGFTPHPKISWAGAAPTGTASEAEYVELGLAERLEPERLRASLDEALPPDLDILAVDESEGGSLADYLEASVWRIELPGISAQQGRAAAAAFLAAERVDVQRLMKNGMRTFDARSAVVELLALDDLPSVCAILRVVVRHATPAVRPDDVLTGLGAVAGLVPPVPPRVTRLAQGPLTRLLSQDQGIVPTAPERGASPVSGSTAVAPGVEEPTTGD